MNRFDKGDLIRLTATFKNTSGEVIDPAALTFRTLSPTGTIVVLVYATDAALVKDSTGVYHVDVSAAEPGVWGYRFAATGSGQAAAEGEFWVDQSKFG